jgi:hypothetical protein
MTTFNQDILHNLLHELDEKTPLLAVLAVSLSKGSHDIDAIEFHET